LKDSDAKAIIGRIQEVRSQPDKGWSKSQFARALGISPSTYSYYERGRVPPIDVLLKICEAGDCDLYWLVTGRSGGGGEKLAPGPASSCFRKLGRLFKSDPQLAEPVSAFVDLLCQKKVLEKELSPEVQPVPGKRRSWIPVLGRTAAGIVHFWEQTTLPEPTEAVAELDELVEQHVGKAIVATADKTVSIDLQARPLVDGIGEGQVSLIQVSGEDDEQVVEFVQCEEIHKMFPDSFALHIDGDSMSPRINDGDIVILSPSVPAAQGHIAVAHVAEQIGVTCKLIRTTEMQVHLIPINERYETKVVARKDLQWALAVLGHISI
jgi:phage repressor protein C with HTH and peptisase S24 domain/transcriptional regulator with XRE-family HTH domain